MMSAPFFSILTPTLQRESLVRLCDSIDSQTFADGWEHLVQVDAVDLDTYLLRRIEHPQRHVFCCGVRHNNFGNTCRHIVWEQAVGTYCHYSDDDNCYYHPRALKQIAAKLESTGFPAFAIFPIHRMGSIFFNDPPGLCQTDTANVVVKREIGRWPDGPEYTMDGIWIEALKAKYPYAAFPDMHPIVMMDVISEGK